MGSSGEVTTACGCDALQAGRGSGADIVALRSAVPQCWNAR